METQIKQLRAKADLLMTTLTAHPKQEATWQITVNFSSYTSLYSTVSDLMKLCAVALLTEEPYVSPLVGNPNIDLANIMELALQLLPKAEPEFLDEVRTLLREEPQQPEEQVPEYNYSTVTVLKMEVL
jgi:hypothetical protein